MLYELCMQTFCYAFSQNSGQSVRHSSIKREKVGFCACFTRFVEEL